MALKLPFKDHPNYRLTVPLEGEYYQFRFTWNERGEFWVMSVLSMQQETLVAGIKLVLDYELLQDLPGRGLPPGSLKCMDLTGTLARLDRQDLVTGRAYLRYENSN